MSVQRARELFRQTFAGEPTVIARAPGRINLIGEHTDYNDGFVFPAAIDRELYVAAAPTEASSHMVSGELGKGEDFDVRHLTRGAVDDWTSYAAGMAWAMQTAGHKGLPNLYAAVVSDIPIGSGVSSSAAIEMGFGVVWRELAGLELDGTALAKLGQRCENEFVGLNSGIMDQMASAMGRTGQAMFLDTRSLEITYAPLPAGLSVVLCDTKKPRALTDSAYNERRSQCEEASRLLGVDSLRDANLLQLQQAESEMPEVIYRRAKHVITENDRCREFLSALAKGDLEELGDLMRSSHQSLRYDYEVSCRELDAMAEASWDAPGCVGARMTGAGFGGACVALVHDELLGAFTEYVLPRYLQSTGISGEITVCSVTDGASIAHSH